MHTENDIPDTTPTPETPQRPQERPAAPRSSNSPAPTHKAATGATMAPREAPETEANPATAKTAREKIAALLWWSVPSSTDEEARERTEHLLDEYADEVATKTRREDADSFERYPWHSDNTPYDNGRDAAITWVVSTLRRRAEHGEPGNRTAAAPDFFQPGHSYTHRDDSTFRCVAVTTHPTSGELVALGWHTDTAGWTFAGVRNINHWNHEYDGVQPPARAGEVQS